MKNPIVLGALMIGGALIFMPVKAQANPSAGVIAKIESLLIEAPVTEWQKDILETATIEQPEKTKDKPKEKTIEYIYASSETLNQRDGIFYGPSGKESYYNLPMGLVVQYMENLGYSYRYWIREDGVKMYGEYVMVAADLSIRPKGTILMTSLGLAIVCDTGEFIYTDKYALDVAVAW